MKGATFTNRSKPVQLVPAGVLVLLLLGCASTEFVTLDGAYKTPAEGVAYRCPATP
jgi:hypothetical protein